MKSVRHHCMRVAIFLPSAGKNHSTSNPSLSLKNCTTLKDNIIVAIHYYVCTSSFPTRSNSDELLPDTSSADVELSVLSLCGGLEGRGLAAGLSRPSLYGSSSSSQGDDSTAKERISLIPWSLSIFPSSVSSLSHCMALDSVQLCHYHIEVLLVMPIRRR